MNSKGGSFRDLTRFCIFLLIYQAVAAVGYGQDQSAQSVPAGQIAAPGSRSTGASSPAGSLAGKPAFAGKPALTGKIQPPAQVPDFRAVISVGRSLSAFTAASVTNSTLTITYSVFNLRADPINGVLLTTTLQSGVTYQSAVPLPDRSGQQIVFSLGSLPPLGSATAQLTVTLANSSITQIDSGVTGYAYWNGRSVQSTALAAVLRTTPVNTTLLPSTINANLNDTYITSEAANLGNDPNRIFQFVRDQVGYESYPGALRGARGTLWSMAGNSLDKASLLIALLRASGIPAQYATGTLPLAKEQQLILSMFPAQTQLTGYVATGATLSDPANDPKLQSEAATHYWVQFDSGNGTLVDADPDFVGTAIGQTFTTAQSTFIDVASNLNQMVTVKLNVEMYQQGFFGPITSTTTPLTQTFTSAELVGHPLTLGHLVQSQTEGFVLSATTNTYTPYLIVGQNDQNLSDDPLFTGQQYQEVLTNFPFGSQILTGVFLEMDTSDPAGNTTTNTHTILDRIGYAARKGLATANVSLPAAGQAAISSFDNVTINVQSSAPCPGISMVLAARDQALLQQATALQSTLNTDPSNEAAMEQAIAVGVTRFEAMTQSATAAFSLLSENLTAEIAQDQLIKAYFDSPRIVTAFVSVASTDTTSTLTMGYDLVKDNIRPELPPGQNTISQGAFFVERGFMESGIEHKLASQAIPGGPNTQIAPQNDVIAVFQAAKAQGIPATWYGPLNIGSISSSNYSPDAQARISDAVNRGQFVIVPASAVSVGGSTTTAWYEINPSTGSMIDTAENGGHQAISEYAFSLLKTTLIIAGLRFAFAGYVSDTCANADDQAKCRQDFADIKFIVTGVGGVVSNGEEYYIGNGLGATGTGQLLNRISATTALIGIAIFLEELIFIAIRRFLGVTLVDPLVDPVLNGSITALLTPNPVKKPIPFPSSISAGTVQGQLQVASVRATNQVAAAWSSAATSGFEIATLNASNATIKNSSNQTVGIGSAELLLTSAAPAAISGSVNYSVNGTGDLSFYGLATSAIGASGNWSSYSATLTGAPSVQIATNGLTLNGSALPQDTYTITASSISVGGVGTSTTPNFAGSASLSVTAGSLYVGPGSGTFTSGGTSLSSTNGITLDGFTGTISITGNGSTDAATINGNAANVLVVTPNPAAFTTDENTPVTFATTLATSLSDTYSITAEAPAGWTVSMDVSGNVTVIPAPGTQSGTFPIFITAASQTDANLVAQAAVLITLTATPPGVTLNIAPDTIFTVPINGAQLPSAFRATIQNTGPAADTFNVTFSSAAGFAVLDSGTSFVIPPGSVATDGIYLSPSGQLPAPGSQVNFTVTVTSATNPAITASQPVSFTVPSVQALSLSLSSTSFSTTPGTAVMSTLTIQSVGNVPATATLSAVTDPNLALSGLSPSVTLGVGQSSTQSLTITPGVNAPLTIPLIATISAAFGNQQTASASLMVQVNSIQALAAAAGATNAAALGRTDIAATLSGLSAAINLALSSCSAAAQAEVVSYVNNLIQEMNAPFLANFVSQLQTASTAISNATCATIGAALTQLSTVLASLSATLSSPAAFPFNLTLQPNATVAQPNQSSQFLVVLQNNSTTTNTYTLSLGSLPQGVTGSLSTTSVTLGPGQSVPVNNASNNPSVTITPATSTAFQFSVNASVNGVAGSTQTALGTMTARNTFLAVQDVIATPGFTQSGGSVDVVTHIANVVNQNRTVQVTLVVNNSSSQQVLGPFTQTVALSITSLLTTVDFGQIATTGLPNGSYTLAVSVIDPSTTMVLPGGTGTGSLLIGSPVSATLTVNPTTLAPGNATVTNTLTVSSTTGMSGGTPFNLIGSVATASPAESVAISGNTVYTCDNNEVTVVNATNPANPTVAGTAFAGAINNATSIFCDIQRGDLVMLADTGNSGFGNTPSFIAFDLTSPLSPSLIASTEVDKRFFGVPYYQGNTAFFGTSVIFLSGSTITGQGGDVVSLDVTNFSAPAIIGTLEQPESQGPIYGGSFNVYGITPYSTTLAYATATTSQGNTPQTGTGQLWVVNTTTPSAMSLITTVNVPGTIQLASPLINGNTAVAIGDTGGWRNPDVSVDAYTGNVVIAVFDLTNPQSPQLVANVTTTFLPSASFGRGAVVIGPHLFLYGGVMDSSNNQYLMLVDTTNPQSPVITTYQVPVAINVMKAVGTLLYAPTDSGLQLYAIPGTGTIQYTAIVQVPNTGKVIYNPASFSVVPVIAHGTGVDTLTWTNPASNVVTWTSNVTGIAPGDVLPVDLSGTVNFTVQQGSGTIALPQVNINSGQILGLSPGAQTVAPGQLASYTLTVNNPTNGVINYSLAVTGVSPSWVTLVSSVNVPANGSANVPLTLQSTLADIAAMYNFTVTATSGGTSGSVLGAMIIAGTGSIGAVGSGNTLGVLTTLMPTQQTGGQGTAATFTVQLTNAGNVADTYALTASTPAGVTATFDQSSVQVPPGLSNFRQTLVHVTAAQGLPVGAKNFTITATSQTNAQILSAATGTLNLVSMGVSASISPSSVIPGGTLHLTVTNLGSVSDTFNLALGGPASVISSLGVSSVTLAPNQSQMISIAVGAAPFATLGSLGLVATATGGVTGTATATVIIPSSKSVTAAFNPTRTGVNAPGPVTLLLDVQNTGTIDDTYIATIVSTSGPITASLVDITGQPVQTTSVFALPGTAQGQLVLNARLTGMTDGSVTVRITSQTNSSITATATGFVGIGTSTPVAIAGKNRNVPTGRYTSLDGGKSYDPSENRLTYAWSIVSKPAASALATLGNATTPQPYFLPDVDGAYTLQLIVNNGSVNSTASMVTITSYTGAIPPNANAGPAANARRGSAVLLNGTASNDPSQTGVTLAYAWTVTSAPNGSALNGTPIGNTAQPSFTPDVDGAFTISLRVSDTAGASTDTVTITAFDPNVTPNAVAGVNRRIVLNTPITIDGSASNDPDHAPSPLTYQWEFVSGSLSNTALMNSNGAQVAFAPAAPGFYVARLDVSDGAASAFDETTVMAAKFCDANADGVINQADYDLITTLLGSAAQPNDPLDPNGDGLITSADLAICKGQTAPAGLPNLYVTPAFLVFQYTKGGPLPAPQSLAISGDGNTIFTIPNVSFPWIKVNPQSAVTPASVAVSIDPTGLAAGPYLGQLLPVANGFNSPQPVRVELTVLDSPQFIIVPGALTFNYQIGQGAPAPQTISVGTSGQDANFSASVSGATWLNVNPNAALTPKPMVVTVTPPPNIAPGTYTATITFTSPSAPTASITVTLVVTPAPPVIDPTSIVNAASYLGGIVAGGVAPGEIIYLGGSGFAAAGAALFPPAGPVPVKLGDTQVFFDNTPAPLLTVEPGLIELTVPYEIAGRTTTMMRVVYLGASSQLVPVPVALSNPGIFTVVATGTGEIVAMNSNGTPNSATNPAARGSTITFYVTGEGQTNPAGVDGAIAPLPPKTPPTPVLPVIVTIGGDNAMVTYAGGVPGLAAGLMQVNVVIPSNVGPDGSVPVTIKVGANQSQPNVTVAIQ